MKNGRAERQQTGIGRPVEMYLPKLVAVDQTQEGPRLPADLAHALEDECAVVIHVIGASLEGQRENGGESRGVLAVDVAGGIPVVVTARRLGAINARAPFNDIEVEFENALLAEDQLGHRDKGELDAFAEEGAAGAEEKIFDELLRDGGATANTAAFHIVFRGDLYGLPIEAMMLIEARVFGGDDGMLEIGGDLAQRNEFVSFVVGGAVHPGLPAALDVHRGGGWIDPAGSYECQRGQRPKKRDSDEKPSKDEPKSGFPRMGRGLCVRIFRHSSE